MRSSLGRARRGTHSVSERPRLTVSRPERARRRSTVDVTNGFRGHALPVSASRVPFPSPRGRVVGPLRPSPPVRRGGCATASDGESTGGRRASAVTACVRRRRTPSPVRGSKSRSSSSRPPIIGLARVLLRRRDERPPGRRFSVYVYHSCVHCYVCVRREGLAPDRRVDVDTVCDKPIDTLGGGSLGSCVDEERSQLR